MRTSEGERRWSITGRFSNGGEREWWQEEKSIWTVWGEGMDSNGRFCQKVKQIVTSCYSHKFGHNILRLSSNKVPVTHVNAGESPSCPEAKITSSKLDLTWSSFIFSKCCVHALTRISRINLSLFTSPVWKIRGDAYLHQQLFPPFPSLINHDWNYHFFS